MKMQNFTSIKDFFGVKTKCIFCSNSLELVLTNWNNIHNIDIINSSLKDNKIEFMFTHTTYKCSYQSKAFIDLNKNSLILSNIKSISAIEKVIIIINNYKLQLELQCNNSKCNASYYIRSTPLKFFISENDTDSNILLYPFHLMAESFLIYDKNLRVYNDYFNNHCSIITISKSKFNATNVINIINNFNKIIIPKAMNFDNLSKDSILSKINTIILYS